MYVKYIHLILHYFGSAEEEASGGSKRIDAPQPLRHALFLHMTISIFPCIYISRYLTLFSISLSSGMCVYISIYMYIYIYVCKIYTSNPSLFWVCRGRGKWRQRTHRRATTASIRPLSPCNNLFLSLYIYIYVSHLGLFVSLIRDIYVYIYI